MSKSKISKLSLTHLLVLELITVLEGLSNVLHAEKSSQMTQSAELSSSIYPPDSENSAESRFLEYGFAEPAWRAISKGFNQPRDEAKGTGNWTSTSKSSPNRADTQLSQAFERPFSISIVFVIDRLDFLSDCNLQSLLHTSNKAWKARTD